MGLKKILTAAAVAGFLLAGSSAGARVDTAVSLTPDETQQVLKMAMAEAEGEDTEGKALVIRVILNRVESGKFPDTVEGVLNEPGAFESMTNGRFAAAVPDMGCYDALEVIQTEDWDGSEGATYFESGGSGWHAGNLKYLFTHGGHSFYEEW